MKTSVHSNVVVAVVVILLLAIFAATFLSFNDHRKKLDAAEYVRISLKKGIRTAEITKKCWELRHGQSDLKELDDEINKVISSVKILPNTKMKLTLREKTATMCLFIRNDKMIEKSDSGETDSSHLM